MKYYNLKENKKLPNKKLDSFLADLQNLCKKHKKMIINSDKKVPVVEIFEKKSFGKYIMSVYDDTTEKKVEKEESDENS